MLDVKRFVVGTGLCLAVAAGCGGPANEYDAIVTGTVTIDGELADSGVVSFHPTGDGKIAIGHIHPDGSYSLRTGQGDMTKIDGGTVKSGEYIATVAINAPAREGEVVGEGGPPIAGPSLVAAKYASIATSDLKQTVKPGKQIIILELERAEPTTAEDPNAAEDNRAETGTEVSVANEAKDESEAEASKVAPVPSPSGKSPEDPEATPTQTEAATSEESTDP
jgi:hypothetical protein